MLKIKKFVFNPFSENTFLISDELNNLIIIDPGCYSPHEEEEIDNYISSNNLHPKAILHTHSHLDHMFGTAYIASKYKLDIYIHKEDEVTSTLHFRRFVQCMEYQLRTKKFFL